jgi:hypothetical protein
VDEGVREHGDWATVEEAIRWGRQRAPTVILRRHEWIHATRHHRTTGEIVVRLRSPVQSRYTIFSAGEQANAEDPEIERWPGASEYRDTDTVPGYGGSVYLVEGNESWDDSPGWVARWEALRDGSMVLLEQAGPAWNAALDKAVEWAKARAPIALICDGPPSYTYQSAGEVDIPWHLNPTLVAPRPEARATTWCSRPTQRCLDGSRPDPRLPNRPANPRRLTRRLDAPGTVWDGSSVAGASEDRCGAAHGWGDTLSEA